MTSLLNVAGFLGTKAPMSSDISLILCVISLVLFILGAVQARQHQFKTHKVTQIRSLFILVFLAIVLFMLPVYPSFINGCIQFKITFLHMNRHTPTEIDRCFCGKILFLG